jgi:hypothetical protein
LATRPLSALSRRCSRRAVIALTTALVVGTLATTAYSARQGGKAASAQTRASREAIAAGQESEARALELQRPFYNAGYRATAALMDMTGLDRSKPKPDAAQNPQTSYAGSSKFARAASSVISRAAQENRDPEDYDPGDLSAYPKYSYQQDPGYQERLDEGVRVRERSASARGVLSSGGTLRGVERFAQDYASNEYQKVYDRIATIAGYGRGAASESAGVVVNTGANAGNALVNAGEARASGYVAQGNAWSNAFNQFGMMAGKGMFGGQMSQPSPVMT